MVASRTLSRTLSRSRLVEAACLGGGLLALAAISGITAYAVGPFVVPIVVVGLIGGAVLFMRPEFGVFLLFTLILFKPDAVQGLGAFSPNILLAAGLTGIL